MLRVINAYSIRFYEFPIEILCLVLVRYLALTLNGGRELPVPSGISKLPNLQFLIIRRTYNIMRSFGGSPWYMPMEIWEMQQLRHLEIAGCDLPVPPPPPNVQLPNLSTLLGVSPRSCTKEILERIPNLSELKISIDIPLETKDAIPSRPFDHLILLNQLDTLKCVVTNPYFEGYQCQPLVVAIPESVPVHMGSLKELTLSGCGFSWESIKQISQLPILEKLELRCHAFRGPEWELTNGGFLRLINLTLEDLDLVYLTSRSGDQFFPCLKILTIERCHKLEHVSPGFIQCRDLSAIVAINSTSEVETWARSIQTERHRTGRMKLVVSSPRHATTITD